MLRRNWLPIIVALVMALGFSACGGEEDGEERSDLELLGGKADIPSWLKHVAVDWGCEQTLSGKFKGSDSAHLFSFPGKIGYEYTFSFKATYPSYKGAVIAVYDSETGQRVAYQRNAYASAAKVTYRAEKSIKYLVAVYSVYVYATGRYTLNAACKLVLVTCQNDASCNKGEFCKFATGCGSAGLGACTTIPSICTKEFMPVCGCNGNTYGNKCEAAAAGVSVDHTGACGPTGKQCQAAGGYCTTWMTPCKAGTMDSQPSDCPMGKSGKCCLPAVTITVDKSTYGMGETIKVSISNQTSQSVFLGGCSVFSWQKEQAGSFVDQGPDKICVWEGIGKEVKAGSTYQEEATAKGPGSWRLASGYSVGCTPGKPLSSAGCQASYQILSEPFTVKDCPLLSMPNPSAFCPDGKIVPKYDADGICITSYGCLPCQVSDCGPALGLPNKLCADGTTMSGPTGKCLANGWGGCAWEVVSCPKCMVTGCSGQVCADHDVITTCEFLPWYTCFKQSECGEFGPNGACAWKQTAAYTSCLAQFGK